MNHILLNCVRLPMVLMTLTVLSLPVRADDLRPTSKGIQAVLQPFVERHALAGAVTLVADKDKVLSLDAVGFADVTAKTPLRTDALFWIASQTKPITGAALMILVDEGKVKLDDPVEKYLPEFKGQGMQMIEDDGKNIKKSIKKPKHPFTIREALSHTSGLPFKSAKEVPTIDVLPLSDAVKSYAEGALLHEPGSKYLYSNAGINAAGRVIEVVSGMTYEEFLAKRLFDPLGMKDTTFVPTDAQVKRLAKSYKPNKDKNDLEETVITALRYPLTADKRYPVPGGGLFSTAEDIGRFCQMVLSGGMVGKKRILSEEAVRVMTSKQTGDALKESYGIGWAINGDTCGHGGAYATGMTIDRKRGLITVFMVQHAGFPGDGGKSQGAFRKTAEELFDGVKK